MNADGVQLPVDTVRQHATAADAAAHAVQQARAAIDQVTIGSQAYGQLCHFLPAALSVVFDSAVVALNGSAEALHETALNLKSAVSEFESTDESAAHVLGAAGRLT